MAKPFLRIKKVSIEQTRGFFRDRWFLELVDGFRITDCGNFETEEEALEAKRDWPQKSEVSAPWRDCEPGTHSLQELGGGTLFCTSCMKRF